MIKRLLVVSLLATAFVFGGTAFAQSNLDIAKAEIEVTNARAAALKARDEVQQWRPIIATYDRMPAPLPALPVPPVMTDKGLLVRAPTPQPLPNFPVAKPQQVAKPIPAIKAPSVATEKGKVVETPNPRPTADFPVAKPQQQAPVAEIKRSSGFLDGKAVVVHQNNVNICVVLSASNNLGRKAAIHDPKTGNYYLGTGTLQGWDFPPQQPVKKVPPGERYEIIEGKEAKS